jgi:preprotein translocase subunit SecD
MRHFCAAIIVFSLCAVSQTTSAAETEKLPDFAILGTTGDPPQIDLKNDSGVTLLQVKSAKIQKFRSRGVDGVEETKYGLSISLTKTGADLNRSFTEKMNQKVIAIIIGGKTISLPKVISPSDEEFVISTNFTKEEADKIVDFLNTAKDGPR